MLQLRKAAFLLSLLLPCSWLNLFRGWRWLIPSVIPIAVLLAWDHDPATCLAFQYPSVLLPVFWFAALIAGHGRSQPTDMQANPNKKQHTSLGPATAALATGLTLSLFVGQLPFSSPSLLDVIGGTYAPDNEYRRQVGDDDNLWLRQQTARIQRDGAAVLATGRIAAHLVGNREVETVRQYLQRRPRLAELADRKDRPIAAYRWILLDRSEYFQQTAAETGRVEDEAHKAGFRVVAEKFDLVLFTR